MSLGFFDLRSDVRPAVPWCFVLCFLFSATFSVVLVFFSSLLAVRSQIPKAASRARIPMQMKGRCRRPVARGTGARQQQGPKSPSCGRHHRAKARRSLSMIRVAHCLTSASSLAHAFPSPSFFASPCGSWSFWPECWHFQAVTIWEQASASHHHQQQQDGGHGRARSVHGRVRCPWRKEGWMESQRRPGNCNAAGLCLSLPWP